MQFSEPVSGFATGDVTLTGSAQGNLVGTVSPVGTDGRLYDVAVSGLTGGGSVIAAVAAGVAQDGGRSGEPGRDQHGQSGLYYVPFLGQFDFGTAKSPVEAGLQAGDEQDQVLRHPGIWLDGGEDQQLRPQARFRPWIGT